jgi:hypothetical protein
MAVPTVPEKDGWSGRIKELATAVSTQAQVANRAWLALTTSALVAVIPHVPKENGNLALPFGLGDVKPTVFDTVAFSILVVLAIAFAAAHAQQIRAQKLAQREIDSLRDEAPSSEGLHPRELFDMWCLPSLNRVAPLAQLLRDKYQFFSDSPKCPKWRRLISVAYYALLKVASMVVYYGLPGWALWQAHSSVKHAGAVGLILLLGSVIAGVALIQIFLSDVAYSSRVIRHLWREP